MDAERRRLTVATTLAGLVGLLRGLGASAAPALGAAGLGPAEIGVGLSAVSALGILARLGLLGAGYAWARSANVPLGYGRFAVQLAGAAVLGVAVGALPLVGAGQPLPVAIAAVVALTPAAVLVPVYGLAGGALAEYRAARAGA